MSGARRVAVVAIGGNALSDGRSTNEEQMRRALEAAGLVRSLVVRGFRVVVVHGNGPQVGVAWLKELAGLRENLPPHSLALCDALTQAEIGTLLELAIINTLNREVPDAEVLTIVTQVEVAADDPAMLAPTKPVGPFYSRREAEELKGRFPDWTMIEDAGRGWRRVVASPRPLRVFASHLVPAALEKVHVVIAGGGGGIPVVRRADNTFALVDAVIDKDRTACHLALEIGATHFFLLTGVPRAALRWGRPDRQDIRRATVAEMSRWLAEGHFPPGSMGPKVEAACDFARATGGTAVITDADSIALAADGREGTHVVP